MGQKLNALLLLSHNNWVYEIYTVITTIIMGQKLYNWKKV